MEGDTPSPSLTHPILAALVGQAWIPGTESSRSAIAPALASRLLPMLDPYLAGGTDLTAAYERRAAEAEETANQALEREHAAEAARDRLAMAVEELTRELEGLRKLKDRRAEVVVPSQARGGAFGAVPVLATDRDLAPLVPLTAERLEKALEKAVTQADTRGSLAERAIRHLTGTGVPAVPAVEPPVVDEAMLAVIEERDMAQAEVERLNAALVAQTEKHRKSLDWAWSLGKRWRLKSEARGKDLACLALKLRDWSDALLAAWKAAGLSKHEFESLLSGSPPAGIYPRHLTALVARLIEQRAPAVPEDRGGADDPNFPADGCECTAEDDGIPCKRKPCLCGCHDADVENMVREQMIAEGACPECVGPNPGVTHSQGPVTVTREDGSTLETFAFRSHTCGACGGTGRAAPKSGGLLTEAEFTLTEAEFAAFRSTREAMADEVERLKGEVESLTARLAGASERHDAAAAMRDRLARALLDSDGALGLAINRLRDIEPLREQLKERRQEYSFELTWVRPLTTTGGDR